MKDHNSTSYFAEGHQKKVLGLPEKTVYRIGVLLFYVLLFFVVSLVSTNIPRNNSQSNVKSQAK